MKKSLGTRIGPFGALLALFFGILSFSLVAGDFNTTILNADAKTFRALLETIDGKKGDDEAALQKALLKKLIHLEERIPRSVSLPPAPRDEEAYRSLIIRYGNWSLSRNQLEKSLKELAEKIAAVSEEIKRRPADPASRLTLQLQYTFYVRGQRLYRQKLGTYEKLIKEAPPLFVEGIRTIRFDRNATLANLEKIEEKIGRIDNEIRTYDIERERLNLLGKTDEVRRVNYDIQVLKAKRYSLLIDKLAEMFILYSDALREHDSARTFRLQKRMTKIMESFFPPPVKEDLVDLFDTLDTTILGRAETLKGATLEELRHTLSLIWRKMNEQLFYVNETPISAFKLLIALAIFVLGVLVGGLYKTYLRKIFRNHSAVTQSTQTLLANLGYYVIVAIAFFWALNIVGVNLSSIALVAGALSVGIGFGLQNVVSNFVSGIILMFERSIKIGDYIEFDENLRGHVSDIRMRSTTITTNSNIDVIVPNQDLIQNRVINWTMNDRIRRFDIPFGVAYGTDVDKVITVVLEAVKTSGFRDILETGSRTTRVIMTGMGDSSVDFELQVWIVGRETLYPKRTRSRFLILIYKTLYEHGIEIPFPQRDIHIRSVDGEIPLHLRSFPQNDRQKET